MSALVRLAVSKEVSGEFEAAEVQMDKVFGQLSELSEQLSRTNFLMDELRNESLDRDDMEGRLEIVIKEIKQQDSTE